MAKEQKPARKLIGYQIADMHGDLIQGDGTCPIDFPSYEVLSMQAAHQVMTKLTEMELDYAFLLQPIEENDIQEYTMIESYSYEG